MICQKCHATVADDLIFCTECGERLHETINPTPTVLMDDSVVTKISSANAPRPSSNLKLIALIIALIAVPISLFIAYRLFSGNRSNQSIANTKPANKSTTPAVNKPKNNSNVQTNLSNANQNVLNTNADWTNANLLADEDTDDDNQTEIWNDRIEIAPGEHFAVPFKAEDQQVISGKINLLSGESIEGYVYFQRQYDEHFPDTTYKNFSIEGGKTADVEQTLIKESYVLVFVNNSDVPNMIEGRVYLSK